jgi:hypothetical protein
MFQNVSMPVSQALPPNNNLFRFYIIVGIALVLMTFTKQCSWDWFKPAEYVPITAQSAAAKPKIVVHKSAAAAKDTVSVPVQKRFRPTRIDVFKPDTVRRKRLETDTIVSGIVLKNGLINVQTLTPDGIQLSKQFETPPLQFSKIEIDAGGNLAISVDSSAIRKEERKRRWQRIKQGALVTAVVVVVFAVGYSAGGNGD